MIDTLHVRLLASLIAASMALLAAPAGAFDLQSHRGARGLSPENTIAAFDRAIGIGVSTIELDIGITADGVPVIVHDRSLNPALVRDASGEWLRTRPLIRSLTLEELQRYDIGRSDPASRYGQQFPTQQAADGQRVPTLAALFERVNALGAHSLRFNIETKLDPRRPDETPDPGAFVDALLAVIRKAGMTQRVTLQSFDWRTLQHARKLDPDIATACLTTQGSSSDNVLDGAWTAGLKLADHGSVPALAKAAGCVIWSPNFNNVADAGNVKAAQALGLQVIPWTVNQASDMARLIDWGVDGLITDYPDRLREVMMQRSMTLPPAYPKATGRQ